MQVDDGSFCMVGSFNLDRWSDARNLETVVAIYDTEVAGRVQSQFQRDVERAVEINLDTWTNRSYWRRFITWLACEAMRLQHYSAP